MQYYISSARLEKVKVPWIFQKKVPGKERQENHAGNSMSFIVRFYTFLCRIKALTTKFNDRPQESSRPFDKLRSGFVMADGAATLILEVNMRIYKTYLAQILISIIC